MGWFRRSDESGDGLYRGDAPVFMPGSGDQEPSAYVSRPPTPGPNPADRPSAPPAGGWGSDQALGQPPPPGQWAPPPGPAAGPGQWNPDGVGASGHTLAVTKRRGPGAGCGLLAMLVILLIVGGIGFGVWTAFRSVQSAIPGLRDVPETQVGTIDVPVTVDYRNAQLRITVAGAQTQPAGGWDDESGGPTLLVSTTIERVDDGSASVHVPFIDWGFEPAGGGPTVDVDIISGFDPDLTSVTLNAGESVSGFLAFGTAATGGQLTLAGDRFQDPPLAAWQLTPAVPQAVTGTVGAPAQPQIGRPPFTLTLDATTWTDQAGVDAWKPPTAGGFLVADLTITSTEPGSSEWVESSSFVFVPAGGAAVPVAPPDMVSSTLSYATVSGGSSAPLQAVFDVAAGPGSLELRDAAGRTMVSWPIA